MPPTSEDHRDSRGITSGDHIFITAGAPRLDDGLDSGGGGRSD
jgi:hypothetical protein